MARKKRVEEHENHERWLVSYADFITLLFAFFVVMYSISSINDGKYRVLSDTLTDAFQEKVLSPDLIQIGEEARSLLPTQGEFAQQGEKLEELPAEEKPEVPAEEQLQPAEQQEERSQTTEETIADLNTALEKFIKDDLVTITETDRGIEVEMRSKMLFESGSARLSREAMTALRRVAAILGPLPNEILVEGHTDNVPIQTAVFPSNWELSASRAASVVHILTRFHVNSDRMAAIGYGQYRPISANDSEQGRQKNRRVGLIVMHKGAFSGTARGRTQ
jgi:chemotaxis protein MotB